MDTSAAFSCIATRLVVGGPALTRTTDMLLPGGSSVRRGPSAALGCERDLALTWTRRRRHLIRAEIRQITHAVPTPSPTPSFHAQSVPAWQVAGLAEAVLLAVEAFVGGVRDVVADSERGALGKLTVG